MLPKDGVRIDILYKNIISEVGTRIYLLFRYILRVYIFFKVHSNAFTLLSVLACDI